MDDKNSSQQYQASYICTKDLAEAPNPTFLSCPSYFPSTKVITWFRLVRARSDWMKPEPLV